MTAPESFADNDCLKFGTMRITKEGGFLCFITKKKFKGREREQVQHRFIQLQGLAGCLQSLVSDFQMDPTHEGQTQKSNLVFLLLSFTNALHHVVTL